MGQSRAELLHGCSTTSSKLVIKCQIEWQFILIPSFLNAMLVYNRMKEELEEGGEEVICDAQFSCLWKEEFLQVSISKVSSY